MRVGGSVIIEDGKILLLRQEKEHGSELFMLPGGQENPELDSSLEDTAKREAQEELGIDIEIEEHIADLILPRPSKVEENVLLAHFKSKRLTEIKPREKVLEWGWYPIDALPENCAPNIEKILEIYTQKYDI